MYFIRFTMPAALLLLLSVACNQSGQNYLPAFREAMNKKTGSIDSKSVIAGDAEAADPATFALAPGPNDQKSPNDRREENKAAGKKNKEDDKDDQKNAPGAPPTVNADWDKKIVKTANLSLEVKNYKTFTDALRKSVKQLGGYIAQEEQTQSSYKIENTIVIRVPVARFDEALEQLTPDSARLIEKKINSEDVTMEFVDTKSRLEAKRLARLRYLDLLKQAKNMDEILQVQNEINDIQEQMDASSGRVNYLSHEAAFSTINLDFYQVLDPGAQQDAPPSFFHKFIEAFKTGFEWGGGLLIGLVSLWPLWIAAGLTILGFRKWRNSNIKKIPS